ncbi:iron-sulfur cluster biosynthesis family protein [Furfurilactobacillus sp. WILCCON 0119]
MKLTVKDDAKRYLADKVAANATLLLATDDGSNKYSTVGGTCAIGDKFQLVEVAQADPEYAVSLGSDDGLSFFTSDNETPFLSNGLTLALVHNTLALKDDSGLLDGAVTINHFVGQPTLTKEELTALGNQIC